MQRHSWYNETIIIRLIYDNICVCVNPLILSIYCIAFHCLCCKLLHGMMMEIFKRFLFHRYQTMFFFIAHCFQQCEISLIKTRKIFESFIQQSHLTESNALILDMMLSRFRWTIQLNWMWPIGHGNDIRFYMSKSESSMILNDSRTYKFRYFIVLLVSHNDICSVLNVHCTYKLFAVTIVVVVLYADFYSRSFFSLFEITAERMLNMQM